MDSGIGIGGLAISKDEVASSAFDLFSPIEIENSIQDSVKITTRPIAATDSAGPFRFCIPPDPEKWTDCESLRLCGKVTLKKNISNVKSDFTNAANEISTVNNFYQSLFGSVVVTLNGVEITDPARNWYPYKAYLETLLSYSKATKDCRLSSQCFFSDTPNNFDSLGDIGGAGEMVKPSDNEGYKKRKSWFKNSRTRYFNIPLHSDICTLRKYLPPNTKLEIDFYRHSDQFALLSPYQASDCFIELEDLSLSLTRYTPSTSIKNFHSSNLSKNKKQVLPIDRSLIKTYTVQLGQTNLSHYNIITGHQLPEQIIIGVVEQTAYSGNIAKNPFNFQHLDMSEVSLVVNGIHEPSEPYKISVVDGNYSNLYADFLLNTGIANEDRDFGLSETDCLGGNFLIVFDRSKEKCNRFHRHKSDSGSIDINMRTKTDLQNVVTVIVYATYSSEIIIDDSDTVSIVKSF